MGMKLGPMGYLFMKKKKVQNKNLHTVIIPIFPPLIIPDCRKLGWRGILTLPFLADCR